MLPKASIEGADGVVILSILETTRSGGWLVQENQSFDQHHHLRRGVSAST
jgi:hypothetical protein